MRKIVTSGLTAFLLAGVAAAPLATGFTLLSADAAYAKSDKAKGGGSDKAKGGGKDKAKAGKSGGGGKSANARGKSGKDPVSSFLNRLTGKDKKAERTAGKARKTVGDTGMHPSELGNMNGALNANINAVLAHVRNGNTNGPVGVVAALAIANDGAAGAAEALATPEASEYADVVAAVENNEEYETIQDYLDAKAAGGDDFVVDDDIEAALATVGTGALNDAVDANETYETAADYFLAKAEAEAAGEEFEVDEDIETASSGLGVYDPAVADDLAEAEAALEAKADAEATILATWNKNTGDAEKEDALIEALNDRLVGYEGQIATAIEAGSGDGDDGDGDGDEVVDDDCDGDEECVTPDDEEVAVIVD